MNVLDTDRTTWLDTTILESPIATEERESWTPSRSGTYYVQVTDYTEQPRDYTLSVSALSPAPISRGETLNGHLDNPGDSALFRFNAVSGQPYAFQLSPDDLSDGEINIFTQDQTNLVGSAPHELTWIANGTGTYLVEVVAGSKTGAFQLSQIDYASLLSNATTVSSGDALHSIIAQQGQQDFYQFQAIAGTLYKFQASQIGSDDDTYLSLLDTNGVTEIESSDYNDASAWILWTAPATGTYFLTMLADDGLSTGNYTLSMSSIGGVSMQPTSIAVGDELNGNIANSRQIDLYSFQAKSGMTYDIQTDPADSLNGTYVVLQDQDGVTPLDYSWDTDGGSWISWTAPADGIYYVNVSASDLSSRGKYTLDLFAEGDDSTWQNGDTDAAADIVPPGAFSHLNAFDASASGQYRISLVASGGFLLVGAPAELSGKASCGFGACDGFQSLHPFQSYGTSIGEFMAIRGSVMFQEDTSTIQSGQLWQPTDAPAMPLAPGAATLPVATAEVAPPPTTANAPKRRNRPVPHSSASAVPDEVDSPANFSSKRIFTDSTDVPRMHELFPTDDILDSDTPPCSERIKNV